MGQKRIQLVDASEDEKPNEKVERKAVQAQDGDRAVDERPHKRTGQEGRGGRYKAASKKLDDIAYPPSEAVGLVKETSVARFPETVEAHVVVRSKFENLRGKVDFPHGTGKRQKVLVFGDSEKADVSGDQTLINQIAEGNLPDVDVVLATPEWMPALAKAAKYLGPRGMMPNPKNNTLTEDPDGAIEDIRGGIIEYRTEPKNPLIHLPIGKVDWEAEKLEDNLLALIKAIGKEKIEKLILASTMGPGIRVDVTA